MLTEIEQLQVEPDNAARIVIDERSGVIVIGRDVRVSTVAVAQGNLTVSISESPQVSQPAPFSRGRTAVVPRTRSACMKKAASSHWCAKAYRCSRSLTASMRLASDRAI